MNCNKCCTPILPGENSCRFCGTVGDYSKRTHEETKPEIIDFTTGDDDVVIIDDEPIKIESIPVIIPISVPVAPIVVTPEIIPMPVVIPNPEVIETPVIFPNPAPIVMPESVPVFSNTVTPVSIPSVTPIISEPTQAVVRPIPVVPIVSKIDSEPISVVKKEEVITLVEEPVAVPVVPIVAIPVPTAVSASTPIVVTKTDSKVSKEQLIKDIATPLTEEKKVAKEKKNGHGLFNIVTFVLIILLIISVIVNCFLLMGYGTEKEEDTTTNVVSSTNQTVYFSGYKVEVPSNWITVTNKDVNYITLMDNAEDWAITLNVAPNTVAGNISNQTSVANITSAFGMNKYLFTSDYSKTINGKDFYIFKGKYYDYSVYIITSSLDNANTVVADLKFKGEVDETVLTSVLTSLATVTTKNISTFYDNDFSFSDISSLITENTSAEIQADIQGNE